MSCHMERQDNLEKNGGILSKGYNPSYPIILDNSFKTSFPTNFVKVDPYKIKDKYLAWKEKTHSGISEISKYNSDLIKQYLEDMENGMNVSSATKRGGRSYVRLNVLRQRMVYLTKEIEFRLKLQRIIDINESQLFGLFGDMRKGVITRQDGKIFKSIKDFVKDFKAFWHWWQKTNRKKGIEIQDITIDLDTSAEKPSWVYLTEEQVRKLAETARPYYKELIWFLFDSGIRAPTELMNIRVSDFYNDFKEVQIREETSKTFGRRIKLLICSEIIKEYVKSGNLSRDDYLFTIAPHAVNKYLKRLGKRICGDEKSPAGEMYSNLTMYDFRHCSCCYWLPRYKSESALKYRFGWKKSDKIHYYSELLGMKDTIQEEDLLVDVTRTEIEKDLTFTKKQNEMLQDKVKVLEMQMSKIGNLTGQLYEKMKLGVVVIEDGSI
jgi:hypothetical protein